MFELRAFDQKISCDLLSLDDNLFHTAIKGGKKRYHVNNPKGEDFDILYLDNNDDIEKPEVYPAIMKSPFIPKYQNYNETDQSTLYLDYLKGMKYLEYEELNEYSIALTKVVLSFTEMDVYCTDPRILWFIPENTRLHVESELPQLPEEVTIYVQKEFKNGLEGLGFNRLNATYAFHNVFFFQWLLNGRKLSQFKYATVDMGQGGGIGANLAFGRRFERLFLYFGLKLINRKERYGKFRTEMVDNYFSLGLIAEDATDENTLEVTEKFILLKTKAAFATSGIMDVSILSNSFRKEMDEYYKALFHDKKVLGILIRGTDFFTAGVTGDRKMATVPQMLPTIHQWMDEDQYDSIFLATEDKDILEQMKTAFGKKVIAVAQERHSVSELKKDQILSDLEKNIYSEEEYDKMIEDTTVNYFYALYMLSRCDSFLCSGKCNGWDIVNEFNKGKFLRSYKFHVGI